MKTFHMIRKDDVSGVSGTGKVAEAVVFSDGTTVLRWLTMFRSTAVYESFETCERIHGHDGRTVFVAAG